MPLMCFAAAGNLDMCKVLVEWKAQLTLDKFGCGPVSYAKAMGCEEVERYLGRLKHMAETPLKDGEDLGTFLSQAASNGCCGAVCKGMSVPLGEDGEPRPVPLGEDGERNLQFLSEPCGPYENTPLHLAIEAAKEADPTAQMARALLLAKADPLAKTSKGDTPLHLAAAMGNESLYERLLQCVTERAGSEACESLTQATNEFGQTPKDCLMRTLARLEQTERSAHDQDYKELLSIGFFGFVHCKQSARICAWLETKASSLLDRFKHRKHLFQSGGYEEYNCSSDEEKAAASPRSPRKFLQAGPPVAKMGARPRSKTLTKE